MSTLRIRGRKLQQIRRDHFRRHPLCVECEKRGLIRAATELDHIVPLADGGPDVESNRQGLCGDCHRIKSAGEAGGRAASMPAWLQPANCTVHIVCGPPGSGKSMHIDAHRKPGDRVIDLDEIIATITGKPIYHGRSHEVWQRAVRRRNAELAALSSAPASDVVWFCVSAAGRSRREWWRRTLGAASLTLMDVSLAECIRRIRSDQRRAPFVDAHISAARKWFEEEALNKPPPGRAAVAADGRPTDPNHHWNK